MTRRNISQVGRIEESRELTSIIREFFERDSEKGGLRIVGISGYGGVGKSFLFERTLQKVEAAITPQQFASAMRIRVDGANPELLKDFVGLFNEQFATRILPAPAKRRLDYFPACRQLIRHQRKLTGKVMTEIDNDLRCNGFLDQHLFSCWS